MHSGISANFFREDGAKLCRAFRAVWANTSRYAEHNGMASARVSGSPGPCARKLPDDKPHTTRECEAIRIGIGDGKSSYLVDELDGRSLDVAVGEEPPVDVRHGLLVAQDIPHAVAGEDQEVVRLCQLDGVNLRLRDHLLIVPQVAPLARRVHLFICQGGKQKKMSGGYGPMRRFLRGGRAFIFVGRKNMTLAEITGNTPVFCIPALSPT